MSDEPAESGGEDLGTSRCELLLWSLGSCTSMTVLMYARQHQWPLEGISVDLTHNRVHALDSEAADGSSGGKVEVITRHISLRGALSDEQRSSLLEIAGRCPVYRTISGSVRVVDTSAPAE